MELLVMGILARYLEVIVGLILREIERKIVSRISYW